MIGTIKYPAVYRLSVWYGNTHENMLYGIYCQISNIICAKYRNLNNSRLVLQLPLCNILKPCVDSWMNVSCCSADRRCSYYIWAIDNFIAFWGATNITGLTVCAIRGKCALTYMRIVNPRISYIALSEIHCPITFVLYSPWNLSFWMKAISVSIVPWDHLSH